MVLTVKGIGIISVLPFACYLTIRRKYDDRAYSIVACLYNSRECVFSDLSYNINLI